MSDRKVSTKLPTGQVAEGTVVQVAESAERWSDFMLQDGSAIRVKFTVLSAIRVDGQYDSIGNPVYHVNYVPVVVVSSPDTLRRKVNYIPSLSRDAGRSGTCPVS